MEAQYGKRIREVRKSKGYTQEQLAIAAGIAVNSLSRYENNERQPNIEILTRIANALNMSMGEFMWDNLPNHSYSVTYFTEEGEAYRLKSDTICKYDKLNKLGKQKANEYITDLSEQEKYTTPDQNDKNDE